MFIWLTPLQKLQVIILVGTDILSSDDDSIIVRDRLSIRSVLAHEYYGHKQFRFTKLPPQDYRDEFRARFYASIHTPNLSDNERQVLMRDALDGAEEGGINIRYTDIIREILYGYKK